DILLFISPGIDYGETAKLTGWTEVEVSYLFKNHSDKEVTVKMGFPEVCENGVIACDPNVDAYNSSLHDFEAIIDGEDLDVVFEEGEYDEDNFSTTHWHTYDVTFA